MIINDRFDESYFSALEQVPYSDETTAGSSLEMEAVSRTHVQLPPFVDFADITKRPTLPPFLIDGLLYQGDKMLITGASKAGKSLLLLELALAVATGSRWLGLKCTLGNVLYVNFEIRADAFSERYWNLSNVTKLIPERGRLMALNLRGSDSIADGSAFTDALIERIIQSKVNYNLIIVDPYYKLSSGDENTVQDVSKVLKLLDRFADATGASVALVHHHSKGSQSRKSVLDRGSGSGAFGRDFDCILDLTQLDASGAIGEMIAESEPPEYRDLAPQAQGQRRFEFQQMALAQWSAWRVEVVARHTASPEPFEIWFQYPRHVLDATGKLCAAEPYTPTGSRPDRRKQANASEIEKAFESLEAQGVTTPTYNQLANETGLNRRTVMRHVEESMDYEINTDGRAYTVRRRALQK